MDGTRTLAEIDVAMGFRGGYALQHLACLYRDCGVGYAFDELDRVTAVFPAGQTIDTAIAGG